MARFKQIPQNFLFRKLLGFWGNMVRNYRDDCRDDDFFDVVRNCFDHDRRRQGERPPLQMGRRVGAEHR